MGTCCCVMCATFVCCLLFTENRKNIHKKVRKGNMENQEKKKKKVDKNKNQIKK